MAFFRQNTNDTTSLKTSQRLDPVVYPLESCWYMNQDWRWRRRSAEGAFLNRISAGDTGSGTIGLLQVGRYLARRVVKGIHGDCEVWNEAIPPTIVS